MPTTGEQLRDEGTQLALNNAPEAWRDAVAAAIQRVGASGPFTADDVRSVVAETYGGPAPSEKAWGGAIIRAKKAGLIERVKGEFQNSTRPISHARELKVWQLANKTKGGAA